MTPNEALITKFYTAFANSDAKTMAECYHPKVHFIDPAFGLLKEEQVSKMWEMLLLKSKGNIKIEFSDVKADFEKQDENFELFWYSKPMQMVKNVGLITL